MSRSNRTLTQFVVNKLRQAMVYGLETVVSERAGNTQVETDLTTHYTSCPSCDRPSLLVVRLFDKEIVRLFFSPINSRSVCGVRISTGDFYDSKGRPSRTTRERLNGILDALGAAKFLPEGVRVFIHPETEQCCIGRGTSCKTFDSGSPKVLLLSHPKDLVFSWGMIAEWYTEV